MRITKTNNNKKKILCISAVILLITAFVFIVLFNLNSNSKNTSSVDGPTKQQYEQQQKEDSNKKDSFLDGQKNDSDGTVVTTPSSPENINMTLSYQDINPTLIVKLFEQGYSSGTCNIVVKNGSNTHTQTAEIIYQPEYSTCAGFSIPKENIGVGMWTISLVVTPAGGNPITKEITAEVN